MQVAFLTLAQPYFVSTITYWLASLANFWYFQDIYLQCKWIKQFFSFREGVNSSFTHNWGGMEKSFNNLLLSAPPDELLALKKGASMNFALGPSLEWHPVPR